MMMTRPAFLHEREGEREVTKYRQVRAHFQDTRASPLHTHRVSCKLSAGRSPSPGHVPRRTCEMAQAKAARPAQRVWGAATVLR
jgi:hypothetical protein